MKHKRLEEFEEEEHRAKLRSWSQYKSTTTTAPRWNKKYANELGEESLVLQSDQEVNRQKKCCTLKKESWRNVIGFFLLGLTNNIGYVIMNAGAKSIDEGGVALVYICGVAPSFLIKLTGPYWFQYVPYWFRVLLCTTLMLASFLLVAYGQQLGVKLFGVALGAAQSGLGEASFLALANHFETRTVLSAWGSGTGFAGILGYAWNIIFDLVVKLSFQMTVLIAIVWPIALSSVFFFLLKRPKAFIRNDKFVSCKRTKRNVLKQRYAVVDSNDSPNDDDDDRSDDGHDVLDKERSICNQEILSEGNNSNAVKIPADLIDGEDVSKSHQLTGKEMCMQLRKLWPYMIPLVIVYFAEYAMQSGTWAAIGFPVQNATARKEFYRYSNALYQVGVFFSRSSGSIFQANRIILWIMPLLQTLCLVLFTLTGMFHFWYNYSLLPMCFFVGLLGGSVYINAFTLISKVIFHIILTYVSLVTIRSALTKHDIV